MSRSVVVTGPARVDIERNYAWWAENHSKDEATRWYLKLNSLVTSLAELAGRYPLAAETPLRELGVRQASFGIGRRMTHRVLFSITDQPVVVYRVRAFRQNLIGPSDLEG